MVMHFHGISSAIQQKDMILCGMDLHTGSPAVRIRQLQLQQPAPVWHRKSLSTSLSGLGLTDSSRCFQKSTPVSSVEKNGRNNNLFDHESQSHRSNFSHARSRTELCEPIDSPNKLWYLTAKAISCQLDDFSASINGIAKVTHMGG